MHLAASTEPYRCENAGKQGRRRQLTTAREHARHPHGIKFDCKQNLTQLLYFNHKPLKQQQMHFTSAPSGMVTAPNATLGLPTMQPPYQTPSFCSFSDGDRSQRNIGPAHHVTSALGAAKAASITINTETNACAILDMPV